MREVISVHVGQAGVQIGNACCKFAFQPIFEFSPCYAARLYVETRSPSWSTRFIARCEK